MEQNAIVSLPFDIWPERLTLANSLRGRSALVQLEPFFKPSELVSLL